MPYEPPLPELANWLKSPVQCIWTGDGCYYQGTVMRINDDDNTVGVLFDDGGFQDDVKRI